MRTNFAVFAVEGSIAKIIMFIKRAFQIIIVLSLAGMLVTAYLAYQHFADPGESFCNVSDYVSCDIVNKSIYSEIFGIPVSVLGFLAYAFFLCFSACALRMKLPLCDLTWCRVSKKNIILLGLGFAAAGLLFSLYFTYVEFFILRAVCIFCVTQQILILFIFITFLFLWRKSGKSAA